VSVLAGVVAVATSLSACSGSGSGSDPDASGGTLTLAISGDATDLDTANCVPRIYCYVAYDPLIHLTPETGELGPGLATEWKWVDASHKTFELTLRSDAKFNDGTPLTGEAAAASINSFLDAPGPFGSLGYPITGAEAAGADKVRIMYAEPISDRYAAFLLAGEGSVGNIVGPAAAADRKTMLNRTDGIGPYKLDPAQTTKGVSYVYVPNEQYFNQDAIKYDKVVLKPMVSPQARLSALQAGEVDWASNIAATELETAEKGGFTISYGEPGKLVSLALLKRDTGPLADVRVRQALAYATPREDIAKALYGADAVPTGSMIPEGAEGYNAEGVAQYGYDLAKAKELLAQAGYADGLTLKVFAPGFFDPGTALGQALKSAYAKVGVTVDLVASDAPPGSIAQETATGKYDALIMSNGGNGLSAQVYKQYVPGALANPLKVPLDDELIRQMHAAATAPDPDEQEAKMTAVTQRLDELVWSVPIAIVPSLQAVNPTIENVANKFWTQEFNPFSPIASEAWATGS
jgi:peptide/nickel transport system substrate-binding protein